MQIASVTRPPFPSLGNVQRAHEAMNAAYNAISNDHGTLVTPVEVSLARDYVGEARNELLPLDGHEARDDARAAARAVLPRLEHALVLLNALAVTPDPAHVAPLLDHLGIAMDHVEAALAGAGWD